MASSTTVARGGPAPAGTPHSRATLPALGVAGLAVALQQTLVIPLLPAMMVAFDVSVTTVTWVFTISLLAGAVATPLLSRFGDMYGKKRMILVAMSLMLAGSVICALAGSIGPLLVGRFLQGTSAAMIPLAIGMIRDGFPRERVTTAIGIVSATMGIGGALGMIVTGLIADRTTSHRPAFWIAAGLATAALVFIALTARDSAPSSGGRPDVPGALVLGGWLICLLLAISQGNAWGWGSARVLGLFATAAALCALWVAVELRVREPLVRLRLLVGRQSLSANAASALLGFSMFAAFTLVSTFVQTDEAATGYGLSGSVLDVGLLNLPSCATMLVASALAGRISLRIGAAFTLAIGSAVTALSNVWLVVSNAHATDFLAFSALQGLGLGVGYAALGTLAVQHVPMDQSGIASGINSLVRTSGGSVAGAATAAVLASDTLAGSGLPTRHAYIVCFALVALAAALAAVVAAVHGVRHRPPRGTHPIEALETS
ncbi:MFS transporter [Actinomadura craniellae]|uniref:MFS transporter n=1 Tax=Actinomadura craniellae TaxID=2231787 RepID=A0A365H4L6_9ACTN|nr:MFS transporter [Actinomadura craniellae]RAY13946.1 MFS transporter [Actinomadura craniellae]